MKSPGLPMTMSSSVVGKYYPKAVNCGDMQEAREWPNMFAMGTLKKAVGER